MDWNIIKEKLGDTITEALGKYIDEQCDEAAFSAKELQRKKDMRSTIMALIKLNQEDITIYNLMKEYFDINSINEVEALVCEARISYQIRELRKYFTGKGMSVFEFRKLAQDCKIEEKLYENVKLRTMSIEKLAIEIKK